MFLKITVNVKLIGRDSWKGKERFIIERYLTGGSISTYLTVRWEYIDWRLALILCKNEDYVIVTLPGASWI